MTRFWISWWQPGDDPRPPNSPPKDQRVLGWWRSGTDGRRSSICALVQADVSDTALATVATDWPESLTAEVRFVEPQRADWTPGDRFPLAAWMQARIAADGVREHCPTCGADEPYTGACGTSKDDTRALCRRSTPGVQGDAK